jgi:flagellar protein FlgJ
MSVNALGPVDLKLAAMAKDEASLDKLRNAVNPRDRQQIKQSAEDFESLFLNIVLKSMRDTVQKSGLIDGGNAEDIYKSMLDDEYSKMMATQRKTGLANEIERFLLTAVAATTKPAAAGEAAAKPPENGEKASGIKAYQAASAGEALHIGRKQAKLNAGVSPAPPAAEPSPLTRGLPKAL